MKLIVRDTPPRAAFALQEAGVLNVTPIAGPSMHLLGIHPSLQTMLAQLAVVLVIVVSMMLNSRSAKAA